jgi:carboxypeptidase C (cathepsin A)
MKFALSVAAVSIALLATAAIADAPKLASSVALFQPTESRTSGSVGASGGRIAYDAVEGTLVVRAKDFDPTASADDKDNATAEASMSYAAYFKHGADPAKRPIMFLFNGGPGSSTVWLHMGAFGPRRVLTSDAAHGPAAPYQLIDNPQTLMDVADLVFVDAPGTGFGRIAGKDAAKAFYGVDQDAHAFAEFIRTFLGKYNRWNSPKYLFGESYGTMRAAVLTQMLQSEMNIDLNGVVLLSQVFDWDVLPDVPTDNPGVDLPYQLALPSFAATAWYHNKLPHRPKDLHPFLMQVEQFAMTTYANALAKGYSLDDKTRAAIAAKLHEYTGLPVSYILKSDLRVAYGPFQHELLSSQDLDTGTLDTRFTGYALDPLAKSAAYDPQSAAISSAYVSAFNRYVREDMKYGAGLAYKPDADNYGQWDFTHQPPDQSAPIKALPNVMPDMAAAMKENPNLKVMLYGGFFDVSTPYYEGWYEMHHLQIPRALAKNIEYHYYQSGHMVYVNPAALQQLRDNVAGFITRTDNVN